MANAAALINEGLWRKDRDFQRLPRMAQCTFCQILSQKDLDTAGGLTLHLELMAKACDELTVEQLKADFAVLEERGFIFVDYETDEILVRSYVRQVSAKSKSANRNNAWYSVPKNAHLIASEKLRKVLASELRRLRWKDADELANEIDPTPLQPPLDPLVTPSEGNTPLEGASDPHSSVLVPVLVSRNVVGHLGEGPRPECTDHETNHDGPCRACKRRNDWDKAHEAEIRETQLEEKRRLRAIALACPRCQGTNTYTVGEGFSAKCDPHLPPAREEASGE